MKPAIYNAACDAWLVQWLSNSFYSATGFAVLAAPACPSVARATATCSGTTETGSCGRQLQSDWRSKCVSCSGGIFEMVNSELVRSGSVASSSDL